MDAAACIQRIYSDSGEHIALYFQVFYAPASALSPQDRQLDSIDCEYACVIPGKPLKKYAGSYGLIVFDFVQIKTMAPAPHQAF